MKLVQSSGPSITLNPVGLPKAWITHFLGIKTEAATPKKVIAPSGCQVKLVCWKMEIHKKKSDI